MKIVFRLLGLLGILFLTLTFSKEDHTQTTSLVNNSESATESIKNLTQNSDIPQGTAILVCHQDKKKKLQQNYSVDITRTFPLIQSASIAMKGINRAMENQPQASQSAFGFIVSTVLTMPAFAATQLIYATCSVVDENNQTMCQYDATSSILGFKQETKSEGNMRYVRNITFDNGDKITVRGKEGNPNDIKIVTKEITTDWHRDQSGQETVIIDTSTHIHVESVENADCSGTLTADWADGKKVHTKWQYIGENKTSGTFVSSSPKQPALNFTLSW